MTAFIGSMALGMMFMFGPICSYLCERFGCRIVGVCGGLLGVIGLLSSSYVQILPLMYLTYGLLWGVGSCMCYVPLFIILGKYFRKNLALASGICTTGSGIGSLVMARVINKLLQTLQWRQTLKILAGQCGIIVIASLLYKPLPQKHNKENYSEKKAKFFEKDLLRNKGYLIWLLSLVIFNFGYYTPFIFLPSRAVADIGLNKDDASSLIGYLAIASTVGRLIFGRIADLPQVNRFYLFQGGILAMAVSSTLCPILTNYIGMATYAVIFGLFEGCFVVLLAVLTGDIAGVKVLPTALGCLYFVVGIALLSGPTVAGKMFDITQSYDDAFFLSGGCSMVSVTLMFLILPFLQIKRNNDSNKDTLQTKLHCYVQYPPGVIDAEMIVDRLTSV